MQDFDAHWNYADPAGTEKAFLALLPDARTREQPGYLCELLTQIARTRALGRRFDEAHTTLDEVETLLDACDLPTPRVRFLLERGRTWNSAGTPERARPLFVEAWESARAAGLDAHAVDAAHMLEIASQGEEKLAWNDRALELAERSSDERATRWIGSLTNNRGWSLHELERYDEALLAFERNLAWTREHHADDAMRLSVSRWSIAKTLRALGRTEEALTIQRELVSGPDESGYVDEELGECLLALGREDEARPHFARARERLSRDPWVRENESEKLRRLERLAG